LSSSRPSLFAAEGRSNQKLAELPRRTQPALALTDTDKCRGAEFSDKMAGYGIQPIIGWSWG